MASHPLISFVKLYYTVSGIQHVAVLPALLPAGTPVIGVDPTLKNSSGTYSGSTTAVTAYVTASKGLFHSSATFDRYEIWSNQGRGDYAWIFGDDLIIVGTAVGATVLTGQLSLTFRTLGGNGLKLQWMEGWSLANQRVPLKATGATLGATVAIFVMGGTNWITGRDGFFPAAPIWATSKLNDALRHKRNLA